LVDDNPADTDRQQQPIAKDEAQRRVEKYKENIEYPGPSEADQIGEDICLQAIALKGDGTPVVIMNTDACKLFLPINQQIRLTNTRLPFFRLPPFPPPPPNSFSQPHLPRPTSPHPRLSHHLHPPNFPCRPLHPHRHPHRQPRL